MHGIEEGLLDKGCAEASDLLYLKPELTQTLWPFICFETSKF